MNVLRITLVKFADLHDANANHGSTVICPSFNWTGSAGLFSVGSKSETTTINHLMRTYLFLLTGLLLVGCGRHEENYREVINKLDSIKAELSKANVAVHWAVVNKYDVESAIHQWNGRQMEQIKKRDALPPETEAQVAKYENLHMQLIMKQSELIRANSPIPAIPFRTPRKDDSQKATVTAIQEEYDELAKKVAEAKAPVAAIVDQRAKQDAEISGTYSAQQLIAEYVKGRFDVVVDSRDKVVYSTSGEVVDITEGVIKLFWEKTKKASP